MTWLTDTNENEQQQGSDAWKSFRSKHIGASEVPAVLGESDFQSAYDLWLVKTGKKEPFAGNWATKRGKDAEPKIRKLYEEIYNVSLTAPVLEYQPWKVLSASLDGYSEEMGIVVEFKMPSMAKHEMALRGEIPATYRAQIQTQLLVSGCDTAHYVSYDGNAIAVVVVKEDKAFQQIILNECQKFWELVLSDTPPEGGPVILESETLETLATAYKRLSRIAEQTKSEIDMIRRKIDELVEHDSAKFNGLIVTKGWRKGSIDYSKVPELKNVDLDKHRKSDIKTLTIKVQDE